MKKIILILSFLTITVSVFAQNDIQLSQQINNRVVFNPAATGQSGCYNFTVLDREQWIGIKDAPSTQLFNFNKYIKKAKLGLGLTVVHDRLGVESSLGAKVLIAYHAWLTDKMVLSFGIGAGIINKTINYSALTWDDPTEAGIKTGKEGKLTPDFDFGLEFNYKGLSLGASSTHLITSLKKSTTFKVPRHIYAYAKYAIKCSPSFELVPAVSYNNVGTVHLLELNAMANIKDRVSAGLSYRGGINAKSSENDLPAMGTDALAIIAGIKIVEQVRISYSYDIKLGGIKYGSTKGSHELMLLCRFGCNNKDQEPHPRFFN
ncbi:MAG TPA: type IX secretion system membrane protein PorP/SprF [Bacteroidales bacterium]|nr:type IX secretion system membrane protein PorP/SprF [Bacteroidales bacterium]